MNRKLYKFFGTETTEVVKICTNLYNFSRYGNVKANREPLNKIFCALCGIAKKRHCRVKWHGFSSVCQPDKFSISKGGMEYQVSIDSMILNGNEATCYYTGNEVA